MGSLNWYIASTYSMFSEFYGNISEDSEGSDNKLYVADMESQEPSK